MESSHRVTVRRMAGRWAARCQDCSWAASRLYWSGDADLAIADHLKTTTEHPRGRS